MPAQAGIRGMWDGFWVAACGPRIKYGAGSPGMTGLSFSSCQRTLESRGGRERHSHSPLCQKGARGDFTASAKVYEAGNAPRIPAYVENSARDGRACKGEISQGFLEEGLFLPEKFVLWCR